MLSVRAREELVRAAITPHAASVSIAALNAPDQVVISGTEKDVLALAAAFGKEGIETKRLIVSHAFHSPLMAPMMGEFQRIAESVRYAPPKIPLFSNVLGAEAKEDIASTDYWVRHVLAPVRFAEGIAALAKTGISALLEIGPRPVLLAQAQVCLPKTEAAWLPSLKKDRDDWQTILESLGELYVKGAKIDWQGFDAPYSRRRVALPTYPFERERYWIATRPGRRVEGPILHPLLGGRIPFASEVTVFENVLSLEEFPYFKDHRVFGKVVVPGAAHLEIARAAAEAVFGEGEHTIEGVVFQQVLVLPEKGARTVQLHVRQDEEDGATSFKIFSQAEGSQESHFALHVTGRLVREGGSKGVSGRADLSALRSRLTKGGPPEAFYEAHEVAGVSYGPSFQGMAEVWRGEDESLARIVPPEAVKDGTDEYALHPAVIDALLHSSGGVLAGDASAPVLPFEIERVHYRRGAGELWAHWQRRKGEGVGDCTFFDASGALLGRVFGMRGVRADEVSLGSDKLDVRNLYEIVWREQSRRSAPTKPEGRWLVLGDGAGVGDALATQLEAGGGSCARVLFGDRFERDGALKWRLDPSQPKELEQLFSELGAQEPLRGVVHLLSLDGPQGSGLGLGDLEQMRRLGIESALHLVQALLRRRAATPTFFVTRGANAVGDESSPISIGQAPLWAFARVVSLEHPELWGGLFDLAPVPGKGEIAALVTEVLEPDGEDHVAVRGGKRYVARLSRYHLPAKKRSWNPEGTWLITGGLGALGQHVARWLVERGIKHLVLTGRRGVETPGAKDGVAALEARGALIRVLAADVSVERDVASVLKTIDTELPPLRGVVHAAGVNTAASVHETTPQDLTAALPPKVNGAWLLHRMTQGRPLDAFVCLSSGASVWGGSGQASYAAANGFLDALVHERRRTGLSGLSVNFGPWSGGGMVSDEDRRQLDRLGLHAMTPAASIEAIEALLVAGATQVAVGQFNWARFRSVYEARRPRPLLSEMVLGHVAPTRSSKLPDLVPELEKLEIEERESYLRTALRAEVAKILELPSADVPADRALRELGLDSMMAVELRNRISKRIGRSLPATLVFDYPTVERQARYALQILGIATASMGTDQAATEELATGEPVESMLGLSDDEVIAKFHAAVDALPGDIDTEGTKTR
jgi:acyl transferase domain-containing protein/acyl carrier protein